MKGTEDTYYPFNLDIARRRVDKNYTHDIIL